MVAICVTEPGYGSGVASVATTARGTAPPRSSWRQDVVHVRRTGRVAHGRGPYPPDPDRDMRTLPVRWWITRPLRPFLHLDAAGGGRLSGRDPTIGYRGITASNCSFENGWYPQLRCWVGLRDMGEGSTCRCRLSPREDSNRREGPCLWRRMSRQPANTRQDGESSVTLGPVSSPGRLAEMAARIAAHRAFAYQVAGYLDEPRGQTEASMVKALACRSAEEITRDAMQMFGGYGYAEEYPVSRFFVDARVLSIFEGAEEVLALKVIARRLLRP